MSPRAAPARIVARMLADDEGARLPPTLRYLDAHDALGCLGDAQLADTLRGLPALERVVVPARARRVLRAIEDGRDEWWPQLRVEVMV